MKIRTINANKHARNVDIFPVSCQNGPNGKIVLIRFVHVHKKYKTRVGDRQRKPGILAQKVSVRTRARSFFKFNHVYDWA